jgi:hypothetical protein
LFTEHLAWAKGEESIDAADNRDFLCERRQKRHARRGEEGERVLNKHNLIGAGRKGMTVRIYTMFIYLFILAMWFISLSARISPYNLRHMAFLWGKEIKINLVWWPLSLN